MRVLGALLRLTRPDSSILIFVSVFLPLARVGNVQESLGKALPTLFIAMCTFIVNDIDDLDTDKLNHPERPLPSGRLLPSLATAFYFLCLALALFTTRALVPMPAAFFYYLLLFLVINYKYVEEHFPNLKSTYVAGVSVFPVVIVVKLLPDASQLYLVAGSAFLFVFGRELCLDYLDQTGDYKSFIHSMRRNSLTLVAYSSQALGLVLLAPMIENRVDLLASLVIALLSPLSLWFWLKAEAPRWATAIMKGQMYGGLYFLVR